MAAQVIGSAQTALNVYQALYGMAPSNALYTNYAATVTASGAGTFASQMLASFAGVSSASLATTVLTNMGINTAGLNTALTQLFDGYGVAARGQIVLNLTNLLANLETDATYGAAAVAWNNQTLSNFNYSTVTTNTTSSTVSASAGQTFTLTTNIDNLLGTAGNDIFNAPNSTATAANATMVTGDSIDGGAGIDTLNISGSVAGSTVSLSSVSNVEKINIIDTTGVTVALAGSSGVTNVTSNASTTAPTFTGIASTSVGLGVSNSAVGATFTFATAAVAGTADTATLTLSGQTAGTDVVNGIETLNIVSSGSANALTALTAANATKINTSGSQTLNLATLPATTFSVDSSAATAGVTYTVPNNATAATLVGGSGNDNITMTGGTAVNDNISLGDGNDTVTFTANLANTDSVDGGNGTDKLASTSALLRGLTIANANSPIIKNFETISFTDDLGANTITTANVQSGINTVELQVALTGAGTVTFQAGDKVITQTAAQAAALTVNDTGAATTDTLTLNIASSVGAVNVLNNNVVINGFETVTVNTTTAGTATKTTQGMGTITMTPDAVGAQVLKFVGDNSVSTGVITVSSGASGTVDASGLTGTRTFTNVGATVGVTSIIGSANSDTIVGSATATTIDGGAGNDNITGGAAADSITGGAGNDTIAGGGGNDKLIGGDGNDSITQGAAGTTTSVDGGAGNDTITMTGIIASGQTIDGGDGTDTLVIGTADVATINAFSFAANTTFNTNLRNIEKVQFADALTSNPDLSRMANIKQVVSTADNGGNDTITGLAAASTLEFQITQTSGGAATLADATGTSDAITILLNAAGNVAMGTFTVTGVENATITANDTDTTATGATADAADSITYAGGTATKTVTVTGNALSLGLTLTGNTAVTSIDGSAFAGALTATSVSTVASTITGGAGADVLTGGTKADVISGGAGSDTLAGGLGADTLDGGAGTNQLDASGMVSQTDGGSVTSTGAVINLGSSALTSASVSNAQIGTGKAYISGSLSSIAAGTAGYLFGSNSASADSAVDTISNFTNILGTSGTDYIVGNAATAQTITGGGGADYMTGGTAADTYVEANNASVASTAASRTNNTAIANGDTITFGNGVDIISNFSATTDKLDLTTAAVAPTTLVGVVANANLTAGTTYGVLGTYVASTGVFTVDTTATSSTANVAYLVLDATAAAYSAQAGTVILLGVTSLGATAII